MGKDIKIKIYKKIVMTKFFENLLERFYQASSDAVKNKIYDEMVEYADSYHPGYTCYDMDMYVALYKCAGTSPQREHALEHIQDIIIDDSYQFSDELIQNFKEFTKMEEFLNEKDAEVFDALCMKVLNFFESRKKKSEFDAFAEHHDTASEAPVWGSNVELKEVAEIIIGANMHNSSYYAAQTVLGI